MKQADLSDFYCLSWGQALEQTAEEAAGRKSLVVATPLSIKGVVQHPLFNAVAAALWRGRQKACVVR